MKRTKLLLTLILLLSVLLLFPSCLTYLLSQALENSLGSSGSSSSGSTKSKEKEEIVYTGNPFEWAGLSASDYSDLAAYDRDGQNSVTNEYFAEFNFKPDNGHARITLTLSGDNAMAAELKFGYSYSEYHYYRFDDGDTIKRGGLYNTTPCYFLFYCPDIQKSIVCSYNAVVSDDLIRFFMMCPSSSSIYVEVFTKNGSRVNVCADNVDSNTYRHTFTAQKIQKIIGIYLKLKALSATSGLDADDIAAVRNAGAYVVNYENSEICMDNQVYSGLCIYNGSLCLAYETKNKTLDNYGLYDNPSSIFIHSDSSEDFVIMNVNGGTSGSLLLSAEAERFILSLPDNAEVLFDYRYSNGNRVSAYYKDKDGNRISMQMVESVSAAKLKSFIALYNTLYDRKSVEGENGELVVMTYSGSERIYPDYANDIYTDSNASAVYLGYKVYSDSNLNYGLNSKPSWIIMKRSDGESIVLGINNSGSLKLKDSVLKFIDESEDGSTIEISYYYSNGNRITYYRNENDSRTGNSSYVDTLDADSAKKLIDYYCSKKDPLDVWEINRDYTVNWILGLDD